MDSDTRSLKRVAAAVAAAIRLLVDVDGTVLVAIAFAAVAVAWRFTPASSSVIDRVAAHWFGTRRS